SRSVTSRTRASKRPPFEPASCAVSLSSSCRTSQATTCAPSSANASAIARPRPCAAPVTIATLPSKRAAMRFLARLGEGAPGAGRRSIADPSSWRQLAPSPATRYRFRRTFPERGEDRMKRLRELVGRELKWTQPRATKRDFDLLDGEEIVATLRFRSFFGSFATAGTADGT